MSPTARVPARRERKKAETRREIAGAARRLFAERGFDAVTVAEVAEAADVSAKTVFNYFPIKEQLFFEYEPLLAGVPAEAVRGRPYGESIVTTIRGLLRVTAADPAGLAAHARVYQASSALRAYGREIFAGRERELATALADDGGPGGLVALGGLGGLGGPGGPGGLGGVGAPGGLPPGVMAALLLSPLREVWASVLLRIAEGTPPSQALALGRRVLGQALALLDRGFTGAAKSAAEGGGVRWQGVRGDKSGAEGGKGRRASITRVAELAGVSATTVSHTLNGRRPVAGQTRRRVLDAIERLGYRPNVLARSLRTSRSQTIGLVIPDITGSFYPAIARGMQDVLGPAGYDQIISGTGGARGPARAVLEQLIARRVDGLAFAVASGHAGDLLPVVEAGIPVMRLGGGPVRQGVDVVRGDEEGGAAEATRYLLGRGHRSIGFVCGLATAGAAAEGPAEGSAAEGFAAEELMAERVAGYRAALAEAGAGAGLVTYAEPGRQGGAAGTARLLDLPEPPDAVLCADDVMAIGALDVARERGLRVPGDLAVMGFGDIEAAGMVTPRLTTVAGRGREIGRAGARGLLLRLEGLEGLEGGTAGPHGEVVIPPELVRRESA